MCGMGICVVRAGKALAGHLKDKSKIFSWEAQKVCHRRAPFSRCQFGLQHSLYLHRGCLAIRSLSPSVSTTNSSRHKKKRIEDHGCVQHKRALPFTPPFSSWLLFYFEPSRGRWRSRRLGSQTIGVRRLNDRKPSGFNGDLISNGKLGRYSITLTRSYETGIDDAEYIEGVVLSISIP
ncbi:hypothetical protein OE88DRAFT_1054972 [Heliocybe sulcata]|uniref:Uncharacterized protein n=1 Tax=Heliocybe sulcata TaxID=5364 RepID=A0A5C3ML39_9AGAM|nr:hypothetical protein OE88DRAFT_1054972 [Heliocybe sulcata]